MVTYREFHSKLDFWKYHFPKERTETTNESKIFKLIVWRSWLLPFE